MSAKEYRAKGYGPVWYTPKKKISNKKKGNSDLNAAFWSLIMNNI
jgi:hypothetical protein